MGRILLGTSGWDYPEWVGRVYPKKGVADRLRYYAERFPLVEVNTTFYRLPPVSVVESWVRRTPDGFRFAAKFPRSITHERRLQAAGSELAAFLEVIRPLRDAGKLVAALLQLPPSLPFDEPAVRGFYESLPADLPVAVEFREESWLAPESIELLRAHRFAHVVVDEPKLPIRLDVTAPFSYVRWHGHGSAIWYDYTYSKAELDAWVPRVRALAERADPVLGLFNNHFRGDAAVNAEALAEALGVPPPAWSHRLGG
ncbi:MAG TPA: DUF72 domain-containing protein [Thermoplasmata archaeon]|nr:DUF72 domain-containing protein [Thermoplasmata archaeon]HUJ78146.1 DUF72 domain-containing protein [Thermoplasmata archaeon]